MTSEQINENKKEAYYEKLKLRLDNALLDNAKNTEQLRAMNKLNAKLRANLTLNLWFMVLLAGCLIAVVAS